MKKIFLALIATATLVVAKQSDFNENELQSKCDNNDASACANLGRAYYFGENIKQDYKKASELYLKACDLKHGKSCHNLGILYEKGEGVQQSYQKADQFYSKACDLEVPKDVTILELHTI